MSPQPLQRQDRKQAVQVIYFRLHESGHLHTANAVTCTPDRTTHDQHVSVSSQLALNQKESLQIVSELLRRSKMATHRPSFLKKHLLMLSRHTCSSPVRTDHWVRSLCPRLYEPRALGHLTSPVAVSRPHRSNLEIRHRGGGKLWPLRTDMGSSSGRPMQSTAL